MPFSLPRLLSKLQSVITIDTANNDLRIANAVVFSDGTRQTTAGVAVDAFARDTANGANGLAQGAYNQANTATGIAQAAFDSANNVFPQIQPAWNTANTASSNTVYLQSVNDNQNTSISIIQGVNTWQNTEITAVNNYAASSYSTANGANGLAQGAYNQANTNASEISVTQGVNATQNTRLDSIETINTNQNTSIAIIQGVDNTQNTRLDSIEGVDLTQNTNITSVNQYVTSAYNQANVTIGVDATQNTRLDGIEGTNVTQNTRIGSIETINTNQNTSITAVNQYAASAYAKANNGGLFTGTVTVGQDLFVTGNLTVSGNVTTVSATDLVINDPIIYIANNNPANIVDIGLVGNFDDGTYQHTGFVRDATENKWKLFSNVVAEPTNTVDFTYAIYDDIRVGTVTGNVIANTVVVNGIDLRSVQNTQNTNITAVNNYAAGSYALANSILGINTTQNTRIQSIETINTNQNNSITIIQGVDTTQNTQIGGLQGAMATANASIAYTLAIDAYQNNQITFVNQFAQSAYNKANTGGSGGGLASWNVVTSNYTVGNNIQLLANSAAGSFTITLPASPVLANVIVIADASGPNTGWSNNNVLVNPNGKTIQGIADTLALNMSRSSVTLVYDGATWQVISSAGPVGNTGPVGPTGPTGPTGPAGYGANVAYGNYRFNATNNQTSFSGVDAYGSTLSYNVNAISVFLNGVYLRKTEDYFANNGTIITLNTGAFANDALDVITFQSIALTASQNTVSSFYYIATNNQTSFGGADRYNDVLSYQNDNLFVYINGLRLLNGTDYVAANGTYITLTSGALANDEIIIDTFSSFTAAANAYTITEANNTFLKTTDANTIFASEVELQASIANTYTKAQANTQFASTGKAIAMAIVFGG